MRQALLYAGLTAVVVMTLLAARVLAEGRAELARAEEAEDAGRLGEAVARYQRAARWYLPWAGSTEPALARLRRMALEAERAGDLGLALRAWRGVRGAVLSVRHVVVPFEAQLREADARIAELLPRIARREGSGRPAASEGGALGTPGAKPLGVALALLGALLFVGGVARLLGTGIDREGHPVPHVVARVVPAVLAGLVLLAVGLAVA